MALAEARMRAFAGDQDREELRRTLAWWFEFCNNRHPHKTFDGRKQMEIYQQDKCPRTAA